MRQISTKNKLKANHNAVAVFESVVVMRQISTKNKLKANHNLLVPFQLLRNDAANIYKEQTESKSQLRLMVDIQISGCGKYLQRTNRKQITKPLIN